MTKLSDLGPAIRGSAGDPDNEQDNFFICVACGQLIDTRDLRQVMWHEKPRHEPLDLDDEARKQDARLLIVLLGLAVFVAAVAYITGIST
jgi:hypothetical protein